MSNYIYTVSERGGGGGGGIEGLDLRLIFGLIFLNDNFHN